VDEQLRRALLHSRYSIHSCVAFLAREEQIKVIINISEIIVLVSPLAFGEEGQNAGRVNRNPLILLAAVTFIVAFLIRLRPLLSIYSVANVSHFDGSVWSNHLFFDVNDSGFIPHILVAPINQRSQG
jgi:hypothetical protein